MKFIKYVIVFLIVLAAAGIGVYYVGTNMASEKLVEQTAGDLADSGQLEDVKAHVESNPQLSGYIEEAKAADESSLPFKTTGQATRVLIQKVGVSELQKIKSGVENGTISQAEAIQKLETELTEEEMLALKVIAYKELYKQQ